MQDHNLTHVFTFAHTHTFSFPSLQEGGNLTGQLGSIV